MTSSSEALKRLWADPEYRTHMVAAHQKPMNPDDIGTPGTHAYRRFHKELIQQRGRADSQSCIDCGAQARDWAHRHGTDRSQSDNYDPRCAGCHMRYDGVIQQGANHHNAKLTADLVRKLRSMYVSGEYSQRQLALMVGVSQGHITKVLRGKIWAHVE